MVSQKQKDTFSHVLKSTELYLRAKGACGNAALTASADDCVALVCRSACWLQSAVPSPDHFYLIKMTFDITLKRYF